MGLNQAKASAPQRKQSTQVMKKHTDWPKSLSSIHLTEG
jgi:hypothetical protein